MPSVWKKITFDDDVPNIGNANLTVLPDGTARSLNVGLGSFQVRDSNNHVAASFSAGATQMGNVSATVLTQLYTANTSFYLSSVAASIVSSGVNNFTIQSTADSAEAGPILNLIRNPVNPGGTDNDEIGRINFHGDNESGVGHSYADITATIIDSDDTNKNCDLTFRVQDKNVQKSNLIITSAGTSGDALTDNEALLKALKIQSTLLETLTRRTQMVYQCGFNGLITSSSTQNQFFDQLLRVSNGVQMIDGGDYTNSTGIIMPFDGYVVGGSFSCVRASTSESMTGRVLLKVKKYTLDGTGDWTEDLQIASALPNSNEPHPVSETYLLDSTEIRSDAVKVLKGDMLLPIISIATTTAANDYRVDDVIAQFIVYSEDTSQA